MIETQDIFFEHAFSRSVRPLTIADLRAAYLVPRQQISFDLGSLIAASSAQAPWSRSFEVAPTETIVSVERALRHLILATPGLNASDVDLSRLDPESRAFRHLNSLLELWKAAEIRLPDDLWAIRHVIHAEPGSAVESIPLILGNLARRPQAVQSLLQRLLTDHGMAAVDCQETFAQERLTWIHRAPADSLLGHVQRHVLEASSGKCVNDGTIACYGVRDSALEADLAAGIVQSMLDREHSLSPSDFALLVPDSPAILRKVAESFGRAGLPLSGLGEVGNQRDLGREVVHLFLLARKPPVPNMARASLCLSPLMPWDQASGLAIANSIMNREIPSGPLGKASADRLLTCLRSDGADRPERLRQDLSLLSKSLTDDPLFREDVYQAQNLITLLSGLLDTISDQTAIAWDVVLQLSVPQPSKQAGEWQRHLGGISVVMAGDRPWRHAKHLLVLGFSNGSYPAPASVNPLFLDSEIALIREQTGLVFPARADILSDRLALFADQIGLASDSLTLLHSTRGLDGSPQTPAATLPLITRLIDGVDEPEKFIVDCDELDDENWPVAIPKALETKGAPFEAIVPSGPELNLGRNLFHLRSKPDGTVRPQSPSRLETLIVSPLAWLLGEMDAQRTLWEPDGVDVRVKGSIAHDVFEALFVPGADLPGETEIGDRISELVIAAVRKNAAFMLSTNWAIERQTLQSEIERAAINWRHALLTQGGQVVNNEFWLKGRILGVDVHGRADSLVRFENGQLVLVDHKKSGTRARLERLNAGWDIQVELYRQMAKTRPEPDPAWPDDPGFQARQMLADTNSIGLAYHLMNDGGILLNGANVTRTDAAIQSVDTDISENALAKLEQEIARVSTGIIRLNNAGDRDFFGKEARMGLYAFDSSPLIDLFSVPEATDEESAENE